MEGQQPVLLFATWAGTLCRPRWIANNISRGLPCGLSRCYGSRGEPIVCTVSRITVTPTVESQPPISLINLLADKS